MANNIKVVNNLGKGIEVHITSDNVVEINWESKKKQLSELKPGDIFKDKEGTEYIVCDDLGESTLVIRKDLLEIDMRFGKTNDWRKSEIRKYLNDTYYSKLKDLFGENAIRKIHTNLVSLDGWDDYGSCDDMVAMVTAMDYMKYHKYIGNCNRSYWMLTPNSMLTTENVQVVFSDGRTSYGGCDWDRSVRPFFILQSDIFVSCEGAARE